MDKGTNGISPPSTRLCPVLGPLPKKWAIWALKWAFEVFKWALGALMWALVAHIWHLGALTLAPQHQTWFMRPLNHLLIKQGRIHDIRCVPILHYNIFSDFYKSVTDGWTDQQTDGPMDGWTDQQTDGPMDGHTLL